MAPADDADDEYLSSYCPHHAEIQNNPNHQTCLAWWNEEEPKALSENFAREFQWWGDDGRYENLSMHDKAENLHSLIWGKKVKFAHISEQTNKQN